MAFRLFRFKRFSSQLLFFVAGMVALVQVAVYFRIREKNFAGAKRHIGESLQQGVGIFRETIRDRIRSLTESGKLMSQDYTVRQLLMQENEPDERVWLATLRSALATYARRVNASVITMFRADGTPLAATDDALGTENIGPFQYLISKATAAEMEQASDFAYLGGKLHVLIVVPVHTPSISHWFGLAFPIDTAFAARLGRTAQLDVTFNSNEQEPNPRILATTLSPALAASLIGANSATKGMMDGEHDLTLAGEPFVTLMQPLTLLGDEPARITLQRSLDEELATAVELEDQVLRISLAALAAAMLAALVIARGVSEPVRQLAAYTRLVAAGDYTQQLDLPRADELGQLATAFNEMTAGLAERDKVRDLLGKVVSPEIATQLLHAGIQLGGEEREVTILFCDLRNFTGMSEKMPAADVLDLLNRYLDRMSTIIEKHGGVIDKYIGDAIMALFGAPVADPDAPARAIAAAREMAAALETLNRELAQEGKPALGFGIGINTARVVAGNMGSKTRLNYTVIGDGVNLASRLEGLTKEPAYRTRIIISEGTLRAMKTPPPVRELGDVKVKGKAEAVKIFALGAKGESQPPYPV